MFLVNLSSLSLELEKKMCVVLILIIYEQWSNSRSNFIFMLLWHGIYPGPFCRNKAPLRIIMFIIRRQPNLCIELVKSVSTNFLATQISFIQIRSYNMWGQYKLRLIGTPYEWRSQHSESENTSDISDAPYKTYAGRERSKYLLPRVYTRVLFDANYQTLRHYSGPSFCAC